MALAQRAGDDARVPPFAPAVMTEHLQKVQAWLAAGQGRT
jgi:hypothetical protein